MEDRKQGLLRSFSRLKEAGCNLLREEIADATDLPFATGSFDFATAFTYRGVWQLHRDSDRKRLLRGLHRVTRVPVDPLGLRVKGALERQ
jgi:methyltransferase family protein